MIFEAIKPIELANPQGNQRTRGTCDLSRSDEALICDAHEELEGCVEYVAFYGRGPP